MEYLLILQIESHLLDGFGVDLGGNHLAPPQINLRQKGFRISNSHSR